MPVTVDPQTATPLPGALPRVLIVDDEAIVRTVMRMMFERSGFATEEVSTAADALNCVREAASPFTVVMLDYTLPDRAGTAVVSELRQLAPRTRIVLTSGRTEEEMPNHGADGYLPKPFTKEQLVGAVRAVTAAAQG